MGEYRNRLQNNPVHFGFGKHPSAIDPKALVTAIKLYAAAIPFGIFSVSLPTLAIAIVLKKITAPSQRQTWFLYGIPAFNVVSKVVNVVLVLTTCPPASIYKGVRTHARCFDRNVTINYVYFAIRDVVIISACVPGLRPFIKHLRQKNNRAQYPDGLQDPKQLRNSSEITGPSSISLRRKEQRDSGSTSNSDQPPPNHDAYKQRSLEPIRSTTEDADKQAFEGRRVLENGRRHKEEQAPVGNLPLIDHEPGEAAGEKKRWVP
ncbi:MAG: hypothetical protein Q9209_004465 [Squamulea sp. 1 TL-2023]